VKLDHKDHKDHTESPDQEDLLDHKDKEDLLDHKDQREFLDSLDQSDKEENKDHKDQEVNKDVLDHPQSFTPNSYPQRDLLSTAHLEHLSSMEEVSALTDNNSLDLAHSSNKLHPPKDGFSLAHPHTMMPITQTVMDMVNNTETEKFTQFACTPPTNKTRTNMRTNNKVPTTKFAAKPEYGYCNELSFYAR